MSMRFCGGSGYALEAEKVELVMEQYLEYKDLSYFRDSLEDMDDDSVLRIMKKLVRAYAKFHGKDSARVFPMPDCVLRFSDEDECGDLDRDKVYLLFPREELFKETISPGGEELKQLGLFPEEHNWAIFA